jgi:hypothetical protein
LMKKSMNGNIYVSIFNVRIWLWINMCIQMCYFHLTYCFIPFVCCTDLGIHCYAENTDSSNWIYQLKMQKTARSYICVVNSK